MIAGDLDSRMHCGTAAVCASTNIKNVKYFHFDIFSLRVSAHRRLLRHVLRWPGITSPLSKDRIMKYTVLLAALAAVVGLSACQKKPADQPPAPEVVAPVIVQPAPAPAPATQPPEGSTKPADTPPPPSSPPPEQR
jgi:hypothetical protein